jgi:hypothetical protein
MENAETKLTAGQIELIIENSETDYMKDLYNNAFSIEDIISVAPKDLARIIIENYKVEQGDSLDAEEIESGDYIMPLINAEENEYVDINTNNRTIYIGKWKNQ